MVIHRKVLTATSGAFMASAFCIVLGLADMASAQSTDATSTQFQSWNVKCAEIKDQKQCIMAQSLNHEDQSGLLLRMELSQMQDGGASGIIVVPFGLDITKGISLSIDGNARWNLPYRTCQNYGCVVSLNIGHQIVDRMKQSEKLDITLYTLNGENTLEIPISLAGFTTAYDMLKQD